MLKKLTSLPSGVTVNRFIHVANDVGPLDSYKHFSETARDMVARTAMLCGGATARMLLRAALERSISAGIERGQFQRLPPLCAQYHAAQLERISSDADVHASWLDLADDLFQKEFGIVSLRLYVAGSNLVDYRCGIPRSVIFGEGIRKMWTNLRVMRRLGGFKPYFQGHIHTFNLAALSERGRDDFYRCCVELFALYPTCLGMFCSSWYYDPDLAAISPRLSYLRAVPVAGGAHLMHVGSGGDAIANATSKSETRRRLHAAGEYTPKTFMFVWGKEEMRRWAREHPQQPA